jgi:hypothetical protein
LRDGFDARRGQAENLGHAQAEGVSAHTLGTAEVVPSRSMASKQAGHGVGQRSDVDRRAVLVSEELHGSSGG